MKMRGGRRASLHAALATAASIAVGACSSASGSPSAAPASSQPPVTAPAPTGAPPTTASPPPTAPVTAEPAPPVSAPPTTATPTTAPAGPVQPVFGSTTTAIPAPVTDLSTDPIQAVRTDDGPETRRVQTRLLELGFWLNAVDGRYGLATTQAVMAFQKYSGLKVTGSVDVATAAALTGATERVQATARDTTLVEIDKTKQLLFLVENGRTVWAFNTSTGTGDPYSWVNPRTGRLEEDVSITPSGLWATNREKPEGWWDGDLGKIYRPKYFKGGIAIHGMNTVPGWPASHGCVRLSLPAMDYIWENGLIPLGTPVWVHGPDVPA